MKYLRNKEFKYLIIITVLITVLCVCGAAFISLWASLYVLLCCTVLLVLICTFTVNRYKKIEAMSGAVDRVLHSNDNRAFNYYSEGELAVLQSEIFKLTEKLREQTDNLKKDKLYLADSIADISHQIRTPLTSLNIFVSMLSEESISDEKKSEMLLQMQKLLQKIEWQINALLKISKLDAGTIQLEKKQVNVKEIIYKALSVIAVPIDIKNQTVLTDCGDDVFFTGDASWTSEAIINIVKNCSEHTPENGTISFHAQENVIYTEIVITDTGKGIDEQDLPHIFERFYKGKNSSEQSVGIGLALAQTIINTQNGTVKAENIPGGGATFTVRFYKSVV